MTRPDGQRIEVRDRRELPFFQVRLDAVKAIRQCAVGPRRLRAIGFYALLCQLANEQRHTGEHRVVRVSYETLARRGQVSNTTIKVLLVALARAGVVRHERLNDPGCGATVSLLHLPVQEGAWTAVTAAMADHLAARREGGHLLRDLGVIVVLLELCAEQRAERGGLSAEITRNEIATRAGLSVDRIDDRIRALERADVVRVDRHRAPSGGRNLASTSTLFEAPAAHGDQPASAGPRTSTERAAEQYGQGREVVGAGPQNGSDRAANQYWQARGPVPAGPQTGNRRAADEYWPVRNAATPGTGSRPSIARAGEQAVERRRNPSP